MGTNYYACRISATIEEPIHIGKCSYGWLFLFRDQNEPPAIWHDYGEVFDWLYEHVELKGDYAIVNEYDEIVTFHDFINLVAEKQADPFERDNPDNFYDGVRNENGYRFIDRDFC